MKRGFLIDKSKERDGLGALQDPRSQDPFWMRDRVGSSTKGWGSSSTSGWGAGNKTKSSSSWGTIQSGPWVRRIDQKAETAEPNKAGSSTNDTRTVDTRSAQPISAKPSPLLSAGGLAVNDEQSQPHRVASKAASGVTSANPFLGQPLLPSLTLGVPKAALQGWYGQRPERFQVGKDQYVSWNDGGRSHELKFTCVFVCPLTGEVFPSGRYGNNSDMFVVRADEATGADVVWYSK